MLFTVQCDITLYADDVHGHHQDLEILKSWVPATSLLDNLIFFSFVF